MYFRLFTALDKYWREDCAYNLIQDICAPLLTIVEKKEFCDEYRKYIPDMSLQIKLLGQLLYII